VGQDCILQAGFSTGLFELTSPARRAPLQLKKAASDRKIPPNAAEQVAAVL
jgi:hypothetical protein